MQRAHLGTIDALLGISAAKPIASQLHRERHREGFALAAHHDLARHNLAVHVSRLVTNPMRNEMPPTLGRNVDALAVREAHVGDQPAFDQLADGAMASA